MPWQLKAQQQERESCGPMKRAPQSNMLARPPCTWHGRAAPWDQAGPFN